MASRPPLASSFANRIPWDDCIQTAPYPVLVDTRDGVVRIKNLPKETGSAQFTTPPSLTVPPSLPPSATGDGSVEASTVPESVTGVLPESSASKPAGPPSLWEVDWPSQAPQTRAAATTTGPILVQDRPAVRAPRFTGRLLNFPSQKASPLDAGANSSEAGDNFHNCHTAFPTLKQQTCLVERSK